MKLNYKTILIDSCFHCPYIETTPTHNHCIKADYKVIDNKYLDDNFPDFCPLYNIHKDHVDRIKYLQGEK